MPTCIGVSSSAQLNMLPSADWYVDARDYSGTGQLLDRTGNNNHATLGTTSGVDSNDPQHLVFSGDTHLYIPGTAQNALQTPDSVANSITGDIEFIAKVSFPSFASQNIMGKYGGSPQRSYLFSTGSGGALNITTSVDGTSTAGTAVSSTANLSTVASINVPIWVRGTLQVNNGSGSKVYKFYTAPDSKDVPTSWTQLGSTITQAGTTSIFDGTAQFGVGGGSTVAGGTVPVLKIYRLILKNGFDGAGSIVSDFDASLLTSPFQTVTASTGETWTVSRPTTGRKIVAVDRTCFLLGVDDYLEVANNSLLNFSAGQSFTLVAAIRHFHYTVGQPIISKRTVSTTTPGTIGWAVQTTNTNVSNIAFYSDDGTNIDIKPSIGTGLGALHIAAWVESGNTVTSYNGNVAYNASTTLNANINATVTSFNIISATAAGITIGTVIRIDNEKMLVTNVTANTSLTVTRSGYAGTTAASHTTGALVYVTNDGLATGSTSNTEVLRIGRIPGANTYGDFEFIGAAIFRRALTADEIARVAIEFRF